VEDGIMWSPCVSTLRIQSIRQSNALCFCAAFSGALEL
jgi:hypothetical protein